MVHDYALKDSDKPYELIFDESGYVICAAAPLVDEAKSRSQPRTRSLWSVLEGMKRALSALSRRAASSN